MHILVIEDERKVANFIQKGLEKQSFTVEVARDGEQGERLALENDYDVIVIDVMIPQKNGYAVCAAIRQQQPTTPILMLTALGTTDDKVRGFDAGADDYLTKPFEFREFTVRLRALAHRGKNIPRGNILTLADVRVDLDAKTVQRGDAHIHLSVKEFGLLEYLLRNRGKVMTRQQIASAVWGLSFDTESNVIDVYIAFLRKKIDKDFSSKLIHTVMGVGYVMRVEDEEYQ